MSGARFATQVRLAFSRDTVWADVARKTAAYARADRDRRISGGQFPRAFDTLVGGRENAPEESIRPGEVILYRARSLGAAVGFCLAELVRRAPRRTGGYQGSFAAALRGPSGWGGFIQAASFDPDRVAADVEEAVVFSTAPFSRKLDVQQVGGKKLNVMVPPGFFGDAAAAVRRAYPALDARRLYTVPGGVRWPGPAKTEAGRKIEYPAVVISRRR